MKIRVHKYFFVRLSSVSFLIQGQMTVPSIWIQTQYANGPVTRQAIFNGDEILGERHLQVPGQVVTIPLELVCLFFFSFNTELFFVSQNPVRLTN